ncbi:MAG: hypothetical protein ACOC97_02325 [Myxococcota bacterium]
MPPPRDPRPSEAREAERERPNLASADLFAQAIHYERRLAGRLSLYLGLRVLAYLVIDGVPREDVLSFGGDGGIRVFILGDAPEGLWVAPMAGVGLVRADSAFGTQSGVGWWAGGLVGYTWVFSSGFTLSIGGGAQYTDLQIHAPDGPVGARGAHPTFRAALGWAF